LNHSLRNEKNDAAVDYWPRNLKDNERKQTQKRCEICYEEAYKVRITIKTDKDINYLFYRRLANAKCKKQWKRT